MMMPQSSSTQGFCNDPKEISKNGSNIAEFAKDFDAVSNSSGDEYTPNSDAEYSSSDQVTSL